jgi:hypothetical protein
MSDKKEELGMNPGTARHRLVKQLMFKFIKELKLDICFQCSKKIEKIEDLSIEHKIPWRFSNKALELYFDLDNIAFSHGSCNRAAARPRVRTHPSSYAYKKGCRCDDCTRMNTQRVKQYRKKKEK